MLLYILNICKQTKKVKSKIVQRAGEIVRIVAEDFPDPMNIPSGGKTQPCDKSLGHTTNLLPSDSVVY